MQNNTKSGLLFIFIGIIIGLIGTLIFGLYQFIDPVETFSGFYRYIGLGIFNGVGGLFSLVGAILFFVGRKEFGPRHHQFVIYALICVVVGIVASVVVSIFSSFFIASSPQTGYFSSGLSFIIFLPTIIGSVTSGLAYIFALYELEDDTGRNLLYIAFIVSIIISLVIAFFSMGTVQDLINTASQTEDTPDLSMISSLTSSITQFSVLGAISSLLWAIAVYLPYKRIKNGELAPQSVDETDTSSIPERICPNCGKAIPNDASICPYCGKSFQDYT